MHGELSAPTLLIVDQSKLKAATVVTKMERTSKSVEDFTEIGKEYRERAIAEAERRGGKRCDLHMMTMILDLRTIAMMQTTLTQVCPSFTSTLLFYVNRFWLECLEVCRPKLRHQQPADRFCGDALDCQPVINSQFRSSLG